MKLYILCHIEQYYPSGGMHDCAAIFKDKESAIIARDMPCKYGQWVLWELDTETLKWEFV